MKWNRISIETTTEAEDVVISALADIGIEGVEIVDRQPLTEREKAQMFVDIMPEGPEDDGSALLNCYLGEEQDLEDTLEKIRLVLDEVRTYMDIGEGRIQLSHTEDKDWINNWKEYFHRFTVGDFVIVPSWEEVPAGDQGKKIIHIDPGTAFGTGMHETTQLVLRQLARSVRPGCRLLDVGTGSGILGIAALLLGAGHVLGTDLDPCAVGAVTENLEANGFTDEQFTMVLGNLIDDPAVQELVGYEAYDIVTANILADVLVALTPLIPARMRHGARYITSGILETKEQDVVDAVRAAGLRVEEITRQGEWVCVTAVKD